MIPLLWRKAVRDFWRMGLRTALSFGVLAAGVAIYAGGYMAQDSIFATRDRYYRELSLADAEVWLEATDQSELPEWLAGVARGDLTLARARGYTDANLRFLARGAVELGDEKPVMCLEVYVDPRRPPTINALELVDGRFVAPGKLDEVVMEKAVADILGFAVGDHITLNPYNNPEPMRIVGLARTAEFLLPTANPDMLLPSKGSLIVVFRSLEKFTDVFGEPMYNSLLVVNEERGEAANREQGLAEAVAPLGIKSITPREANFSYRFLDQDLKSFGVFIPVVAGIFGLVTLLVLLLSLIRLMSEQKRETGAALALGCDRGQIIVAYLFAAAVYALAAGVVGAALSPLVTEWLATAYSDAIGLPPARIVLSARTMAGAAAAGFVAALVAVLVPAWRATSLTPARAMRGDTDTGFVKSPRVFELILRPFGRSPAARFGMRNILRRSRLTFAVVMLIALALAMSLAFRYSQTAWNEYADMAFAHEAWDGIVAFKVALPPEEAAPIFATPGVAAVEPFVSGFAEVCEVDASGCLDFRIMGEAAADTLRSFRFVEGKKFNTDDEPAIIMNNNFNKARPYRLGEEILLKNLDRRERVRVIGLIDDMTIGLGYVPIQVARRLLDIPVNTSGFMARFDQEPRQVKKALFTHEMVTYVSLKAEIRELVTQYLEVIWSIISSAIWVSMVLAGLFMLTGLSMVVLEREGEYATLRTYGFSMIDISRMIYVEVGLQTVLAVLLSFPLSALLGRYIQYQMAQAWFAIEFHYFAADDLWRVFLPCVLAIPLAALPPIFQVSRVPPARALRARGIG